MPPPSFRDVSEIREEALVLWTVDYGDADRIVTLFTRGQGKLGVFAKGARASRRRFAGALEPFTLLEVRLRPGRGELLFLDSCSIRDSFLGLRGTLEGIAYAGHAAELCRELCKERQPHEGLYDLLLRYLEVLAKGRTAPLHLLAFELLAVGEAGLAPRLDACAICGGGDLGERVVFDPSQGGILCRGCVGAANPGAFSCPAGAVHQAARLQREGAGSFTDLESALMPQVRQLVRRTTRSILGRDPRTLQVFDQLGIEG